MKRCLYFRRNTKVVLRSAYGIVPASRGVTVNNKLQPRHGEAPVNALHTLSVTPSSYSSVPPPSRHSRGVGSSVDALRRQGEPKWNGRSARKKAAAAVARARD